MSIILNHVSYIYSEGTGDEVKALDDVSLQIDDGEFVAIIGHTGSGKTTLVQHMNGLLRPSRGQVLVDGEDIWAKDVRRSDVRSKVGLVFQYPEYQLFEEDVFKDVCFGPKNLGLTKSEAEARAYEALELMGLSKDKWYSSPFELSGGQKRRAAIAGVLAMKPKTLVLDEPTAGLDPKGRDELMELMRSLREKSHMTIVLISHSMDDVAKYSERVIVMERGRVLMNGAPKEVFPRHTELEAIGLSAPSVTYIMEALRDAGFDVTADALTVEEAADEICLKI